MTDDQFEKLIRRLEPLALSHPRVYKTQVVLLALLGDFYVVAILLLLFVLLLILCAAATKLKALAFKLVIGFGLFLWMILKALWVKLDPPTGIEISAQQAPRLFALIDELYRELKSSRFHHVLITDDYNAGVMQLPRLGPFGWPRNYLLLGLPLMKALTVEQFKAVLAHEFGHLAKGHGKISSWIYCQRLRWSQLVGVLEASKSAGLFLFKPFMAWFSPYFNAYSFPMARAEEYEADAVSARLTSPQTAAEALTTIKVFGSYLSERYWPRLYEQADELPKPDLSPYAGLSQGLSQGVDPAAAKMWLDRAFTAKTNLVDTHPSLEDRVKALNETPHLNLLSEASTADKLLDDQLTPIITKLDQQWRERVLSSWESRHKEVQEGRSQLSELDARVQRGDELTLAEAYERAQLTESIGHKPDDALSQFRLLYERNPESAMACFGLGSRLVARDDSRGVALIEQAMKLDELSTARGCEVLRDYHWRNDRKEEAQALHKRMTERLQLDEADAKERNRVTLNDRFEPHGLSDEALAALVAQLKETLYVHRAYLVRKRVSHRKEIPCYVFGYGVNYTDVHENKGHPHILESVTFPSETIIFSVEGNNHRFERKLKKIRGARIV